MALLNFEQQRQRVTFANDFDVCAVCKLDLAKEKGLTVDAADTFLKKQLTGEKVFKLAQPAICLCGSCIEKIHKELNPVQSSIKNETDETAVTEKTKTTKEKSNEKGKNKK